MSIVRSLARFCTQERIRRSTAGCSCCLTAIRKTFMNSFLSATNRVTLPGTFEMFHIVVAQWTRVTLRMVSDRLSFDSGCSDRA
jgi:hypothetical protein